MLCLRRVRGNSGGPVVRTLLSLTRTWVQYLVRELKSCKLHSIGNEKQGGKKNRKRKKTGKKEKKMNHGFHESHAVPTSSTGKLKICDVKWELDHKKNWVPKNWCFQTVVLKKTPESPLDSKEIKSVNPKGNQHWIVIRRTDAEVEAPILWPPDMKNQLIGNDLDAGKDWGQKETGLTEEETVGWHHQLNRHEFEQTPGNSEGQGNLACCS